MTPARDNFYFRLDRQIAVFARAYVPSVHDWNAFMCWRDGNRMFKNAEYELLRRVKKMFCQHQGWREVPQQHAAILGGLHRAYEQHRRTFEGEMK
jgi:hypothetical protein